MEDKKGLPPGELPDYEQEESSSPLSSGGSSAIPFGRHLFWIVLLILVLFGAPPLYRAVKNLRAESLATQSFEAFAYGDPARGLQLIRQALSLSPGSTFVVHATEVHNARAGDRASMEKVIARIRESGTTNEELLGTAEMLLQRDRGKEAEEALSRLPSSLSSGQSLRRTLVEAGILAGKGDMAGAAALCLRNAMSHPSAGEGRLRTQAALYLLNLSQPARTQEAVEILTSVLHQRTGASLAAWRILAQLALRHRKEVPPLFPSAEISRIAALLEGLRGVTSSDRLLAADLVILADPSAQDSVITRLQMERKGSPRNEMLEYARWLNIHRMPRQVIDLAGENLPTEDTDWLLIVLDARSALGDWKAIPNLLQSPAGEGIPAAVKHMYLARIATVDGHPERAEEEWRRVGGLLHLEKPEVLAYIAGYAEQIGAYDRAARAYRELADRKDTAVTGLVGLIRCQSRTVPAGKLIPIYEELLRVSPGQIEAEGDLAYLRLLINADVRKSEETARRLLESRPDSLARISAAALGLLRLGDPKAALHLYDGKMIDWPSVPEPWRAIRVAVLNANGESEEGSRLAGTIPNNRLRPEEAELLTQKAASKSPVVGSP